MANCDQIKISALYDCQTPLQGGVKPKLILINLDDFGAVTPNVNDILTAITLQPNRCAFLFEGFQNSVIKSEEMVTPDSKQSVYRHKLMFTIYDISQQQKNNIQSLALGRVIAITENTQKGPNTFEVYGLNSGLVMVAGEIRSSNSNNGAFRITLQSPEGEEEVKLPQTLFITDYATTLATVVGLTFAPGITSLNVSSVNLSTGTAVTVTGTNLFGGVGSNQVLSVTWVNQVTGARITEPSVTVASNTSLSYTSRTTVQNAAFVAGSYKLEIATTRGVVLSTQIISAS